MLDVIVTNGLTPVTQSFTVGVLNVNAGAAVNVNDVVADLKHVAETLAVSEYVVVAVTVAFTTAVLFGLNPVPGDQT
jgi:hypothetical protein